ncbi:hypothetical protein AGLY_010920 [Aphis glycines]|uniref:Uncharacterized protein n=1 Tax=Aphis glycines TaxID=307491 RepID=A0A6G0TCK2_APHGL|nr:hypothetical protein AGLY_010920 [Aphis glycines]
MENIVRHTMLKYLYVRCLTKYDYKMSVRKRCCNKSQMIVNRGDLHLIIPKAYPFVILFGSLFLQQLDMYIVWINKKIPANIVNTKQFKILMLFYRLRYPSLSIKSAHFSGSLVTSRILANPWGTPSSSTTHLTWEKTLIEDDIGSAVTKNLQANRLSNFPIPHNKRCIIRLTMASTFSDDELVGSKNLKATATYVRELIFQRKNNYRCVRKRQNKNKYIKHLNAKPYIQGLYENLYTFIPNEMKKIPLFEGAVYKYTCHIDLSTVSSVSELRKNIEYQETNNKSLLNKENNHNYDITYKGPECLDRAIENGHILECLLKQNYINISDKHLKQIIKSGDQYVFCDGTCIKIMSEYDGRSLTHLVVSFEYA